MRRCVLLLSTLAAALSLAPGALGAEATLVAAGDIASCESTGDEATAALVDARPDATVATLGDTVYEAGTDAEFANCYEPTWGRAKARTRPAVGNHEYATPGAAGYYRYFGAAAGDPAKGYYSYELGDWHVVVLNTNCAIVSCDAGSAQERWLRADLAASTARCTVAYGHHPRFSSGTQHGSTSEVQPLWQALYDGGVDVSLASHEHVYERFGPQTPGGLADASFGIRHFNVGTGGKSLYSFGTPLPNSEVRDASTSGVLELTLGTGTYSWRFVPVAGQTFTDSGSGACHDAPPAQQPSRNLIANGSFESGTTGWGGYQSTLATVSGGSDGAAAARVTAAAGATAYSIVTSRDPVTATVAGTAYSVSAAIRGGGTRPVCLRLREWIAGSVAGSAQACRVPTASWATITFPYAARGGGSIDVYAYQLDAPLGASFDIDAVLLTDGAPPPPADTRPPETTISAGPSGTVTETSATFTFAADETGSTFECSLDGAAFTACTSPRSYSGLSAATHTFDVRARDGAGNVDATPARRTWTISPPPPPAGANLLRNGDFEGSVSGWSTYYSALALVTGGVGGTQAVSVSLNGTVGSNGFSIVASPYPVTGTAAGAVYHAGASVRSTTGKRLCLRIREWSAAGTVLGAREACVAPGTGWTAFPTLTYTAAGGGSLDLYAYQYPAAAGDSFALDAVSLVRG